MVVLRVAYYRSIQILYYSLLVALNQNNIIFPSYALGTSGEWWSYLLILATLSND